MLWQVEWPSKNRFPLFIRRSLGLNVCLNSNLCWHVVSPRSRDSWGPLKFAFSGDLSDLKKQIARSLAKKRIAHCFSMKFRACPTAGSVTVKSVALRPQPVDAMPVWKACLNNSIGTLAPVRHVPTQAFAKTPPWGISLVPNVSSLQNPPSSQFRYTTASWPNLCGFPTKNGQFTPWKQTEIGTVAGKKPRQFFEQLGCSFQGG